MSALARVLLALGCKVAGSDRSFDRGEGREVRAALVADGVSIFAQDGHGVGASGAGELVVSSAVEASVPDVKAAIDLRVPIRKRAEILAELFNHRFGVGIAGTSGKSTVTAMLGHILRHNGGQPTVVNGGIMLNSTAEDGLGNAWCGGSDQWVVEVDESDRSIAFFQPQVSVLTTVSEDHLPMPELRSLFGDFVSRAGTGAVVNLDCPESRAVSDVNSRTATFAIDNPAAEYRAVDLVPRQAGVVFTVDGTPFELGLPGRHNVLNALAATAAAGFCGVSLTASSAALKTFRGVKRRLQIVGTSPQGVTVIDDFAHNPEKIDASLSTLRQFPGRIIVFYQPHGYGPTRMMRAALVEKFARALSGGHVLLMPDIYYSGGTAKKDICSADLLADIARRGVATQFCPQRSTALSWIVQNAKEGDRVVIMGARDNTLPAFAAQVLAALDPRSSASNQPERT